MMFFSEKNMLPDFLNGDEYSINSFYTEAYIRFAQSSHSDVVFVYNEQYCQAVNIHPIYRVFVVANLPSEPICMKGVADLTTQQKFLDEVIQALKKKYHIDWLTVTPASSLFLAYPQKSERILFGNYVIDLRADEEVLFTGLNSKHRNMVRRGERGEITIRFGGEELLSDYMQVDKQTWARSGQNVDHTEYYRNYIRCFGNQALVGIAYKDGIPQCGLIGLYNHAMFYYMFGASADHPEPGATHYLQWQTILRMKRENVQSYNFVGCRINVDPDSKYQNIQHFKKGFGGELVQCYLFRTTLNPLKKTLFNLLLKLKTGRTPNDVIDQEMGKWKEINQINELERGMEL